MPSIPHTEAPTAPAAGTVLLDRYVLVRPLGRGGGGETWLGRRTEGGAQVAIKVVPHDSTSDNREMLREASLLARVQHPHLVRYEGCFDLADQGLTCLVTEYVGGGDLEGWWRSQDGEVDGPALARLLLQLVDAIAAVHQAGVLHRDLKPANVLVAQGDETAPRLVLADLGLARRMLAAEVRVTGRLGTHGYAAPEQWTGEPLTPATDIYGLGGLAWYLVAGEHPLPEPGSTRVDPRRLQPQPRVVLGAQGAAWRRLLAWQLEKAPGRRPTLPQVRDALERLADGQRRLVPWTRGALPWVAVGLAGAGLVGLAGRVDAPDPAPSLVPTPTAPTAASVEEPVLPEAPAPEPPPDEPVPRKADPPPATGASIPASSPAPQPIAAGRIDSLRLGLADPLPLGTRLVVLTADGAEHATSGGQAHLRDVPEGELTVALRGPGGTLDRVALTLDAEDEVRLRCRLGRPDESASCDVL